MRKAFIPAALSAPFLLGGCAAIGGDGLLGDLFGGGNDYGYDARTGFERDAVKACGDEASRFGRATVIEAEATEPRIHVRFRPHRLARSQS